MRMRIRMRTRVGMVRIAVTRIVREIWSEIVEEAEFMCRRSEAGLLLLG